MQGLIIVRVDFSSIFNLYCFQRKIYIAISQGFFNEWWNWQC